ncbi:hypothetical protein IWQ60_003738 [Tieghemiomyces parasiticus]|uniref:Zn(2)-C6 fungal-type domain-containing protein n=1 Tax=Tieghemiomyces parasiticus TaxID=78921 RepID=A0A9W8DZY7_9FUNG|nr:hypothetical protein IWQ60_003738 [Tieghemiomyces parasiticus]
MPPFYRGRQVPTFKVTVPGPPKPPPPPKELKYQRHACTRCVARKAGCDGQQPCIKCTRAGVADACQFSKIARQPPRRGRQRRDTGGSDIRQRKTDPVAHLATSGSLDSISDVSPRAPTSATVPSSTIETLASSGPPASTNMWPLPPSLAAVPTLKLNCPAEEPRSKSESILKTTPTMVPLPPLRPPLLPSPPTWRPMAIQNLLTPPHLISPTLDATPRHKITPWDFNASLPPAKSLLTYYSDVRSFIPSPADAEQFLETLQRTTRIARSLKSFEDMLYSPVLVRSLLALYVMHQVRLFCKPFLARLYRKLDRQELRPIALDSMLCYGISVLSERQLESRDRHRLSAAYLERISHAALHRLCSCPAVDTPFLMYQVCRVHAFHNTDHNYVNFMCKYSPAFVTATDYPIRPIGQGDAVKRSDPTITRSPPWDLTWMITQRQYHLTDLHDHPTPVDPRRALHQEIALEFRRRTFYEVTALESVAGCQLGLPSQLDTSHTRVNPISDEILLKLFALPPEEDTFPALIPCLTHSVSGYPSLITLSSITNATSALRAHVPPHNPADVNLQPYLEINQRLNVLYPQLLREFPILPRKVIDPERDNPVYMAGTCMVHSVFHATRLFANLHNWNFGSRAFRPESYPALRRYGSESADYFTRNCLPFIKHVPVQAHNLCTSLCCFLACYWYINRLPYISQDADQIRRDMDTIRMYRAYLDEFEPFVAYIESYKSLIARALESVHCHEVDLIPVHRQLSKAPQSPRLESK